MIKLNLGAGDKSIPGYTSVDIAPSRKGVVPDILCDLASDDLFKHFKPGSVDEILSVHVVEHFYRYEIEAVLHRWHRLLKPGGNLIVECPNLLYACQQIVKDGGAHTTGPDKKDGQTTMWVLYGNPGEKDPLMCHKWGYTPDSLRSLLQSVGFVNVWEEPAQFKAKNPRDMRVVGVK